MNEFKDARDEKQICRTIELALEFAGGDRRSARGAAYYVAG